MADDQAEDYEGYDEADYDDMSSWDGAGTDTLDQPDLVVGTALANAIKGEKVSVMVGNEPMSFDLPPMVTQTAGAQVVKVPGGMVQIHQTVMYIPDVPPGLQRPVQCVNCGGPLRTETLLDHEGSKHTDAKLCQHLKGYYSVDEQGTDRNPDSGSTVDGERR